MHSVEGLRSKIDRRQALDFGTYFHKLLEIKAKHPHLTPGGVIQRNNANLDKSLIPVANVVFRKYVEHYKETKHNYLSQEDVFDVPYNFGGNRKIRLRGRFDEIISKPDGSIWIQENKTKERINPSRLDETIPRNLQTMFYAVAASLHYNRPVSGVLYQVVRKPSIKQKQKESEEEFIERLEEDIDNRPDFYFFRWEIHFPQKHIENFKRTDLNPHLRALEEWWESIKNDPFSPWLDAEEKPNPHHWKRPFGVYEPMTNGTGDFYDIIALNKRNTVTSGNDPFPELKD